MKKNHDALTGLVNRNLLWDRLEHALHIAKRNKSLVATVLIDVDDFKVINDTLGHDAGDEILKIIAERLQTSVRDSDTVARLGGDEFVVILYDQPSLTFILNMIERLHKSVSKTATIENKDISISVSMGISVFPHDGSTAEELVKVADIAMYKVKASGRNNFQLFSDLIKSPIDTKIELEKSMQNALDHDEMFLVFQPKISIKTNKIVGAEAFLRWHHPEKGILEAASFIPEAEENGLIIPFGEWVLNNICKTLQRLKLVGFHNIPVSMNVSFRELCQNNYAGLIQSTLHQAKLSPEILELEIQEKHLMHNINLTGKILSEISKLGVKLTIDEFGAELSSLSNLHKLPVNHLKISKSFIESNFHDSENCVMAKTMIGIGNNMNIEVIAECVETSDQLNFLTLHGCNQIQGNYFSEPICLSEFEKLLQAIPA